MALSAAAAPRPTVDDTQALWRELCREAAEIAGREPLLATMLDRVVLDHDGLGSALASLLADKIADRNVAAEPLAAIVEEALADEPVVLEQILSDLRAIWTRDPAAHTRLHPFLHFKGFHALETHRIAHWLWRQGRRDVALFLQSRGSEVFAVDIHPAVPIGSGVFIDHGTGVVIGETAVVGNDVSILQEVTLGGTGKEVGDRHPKIRDGVLLSAGAKILGNIEIGRSAKVGAGSIVLRSVPPCATVVGVPARIVGWCRDTVPALAMDQSLDGSGSDPVPLPTLSPQPT